MNRPERPVGEGTDPGRERWRETLRAKALAAAAERRAPFQSSSGIGIRDLYTPADIAGLDEERDLGRPGAYPFTRGVQPTMYRSRFWTMRQYAGFATAEETNRRFRYLLEQGQTGLSVAFDLPTQMGYDSDAAAAEGEVGRVGVPISSLADMAVLVDGLPLSEVSTSMTINATAPILLAIYVAAAEAQGVARASIAGTTQNDILKEYIARGTYIFPPRPSMRLVTDVFEFCAAELPRWNTISISGYHIREAGSTAAQELAFTLANGMEYVRRGVAAGLAVDDFAPRLSFFFDSHLDFFEEIAKFRAARRIWARKLRDEFGAKDPRSWMVRFHTQTAGVSLTAQQPENNIVRTAFEALAAVLGGTQSLHTNSMDETLSLPTEKAVKIALRTQQVIAEETEVAHVVDPLGGSYFVEALTDKLEEQAEAYFREIEERGGVVPAIESGFFQSEIHRSAVRYQRQLERGEKRVVGINCYVEDESGPTIDLHRIDPAVESEQRARLEALRSSRDAGAAQAALDSVRAACKDGSNLLERFIKAAHADCTLGEIAQVLREEFGKFQEPKIL
jgi:methylmalonyl-CoA mutase N-terminal domain/subunit